MGTPPAGPIRVARVVTQAVLLMLSGVTVAGCEDEPVSHAGSYPGDFGGGYAGLGPLREDGTATGVQLTFSGQAEAEVSVRTDRRLELSMPGCRLTLAGEDGAPSLAIEGAEGACEIPVGGSVGTVPVRDVEGDAHFAQGHITLAIRAAAPPREEGAPEARVTFGFEGQRVP